jgi:hypothetical protein
VTFAAIVSDELFVAILADASFAELEAYESFAAIDVELIGTTSAGDGSGSTKNICSG